LPICSAPFADHIFISDRVIIVDASIQMDQPKTGPTSQYPLTDSGYDYLFEFVFFYSDRDCDDLFFIIRFNRTNEDRLSKSIQVMANEIDSKIRSQLVFDDVLTVENMTELDDLEKK